MMLEWFKQRQVTGLLAFSQSNDQKLETLNNLLDHLTGIVRLGGDRDGLELTFLYWRSTQGVVAAQNHRLYTNESGFYSTSRRRVERAEVIDAEDFEVEGSHDWSEQPVPATPRVHVKAKVKTQSQYPQQIQEHLRPQVLLTDEDAPAFLRATASAPTLLDIPVSNTPHSYLYADPEFEVLRDIVPGVWQFVVRIENILHLALDKPRAMILVSTDQSVNAIDLARTVHMMRKTLGLGVQILVRETHRVVDESYKNLLLQSGANVVVSKDIALEYYPKFLSSLRSQKFLRSFEPDFASLLAGLPMDGHMPSIETSLSPGGSRSRGLSPSISYHYPKGSAAKSEPIAHRAIAKARRSSLTV
jgi:Cellulose biosynthesis GIL